MGDGWLYAMKFGLQLRKCPPQAGLESGTASLADWLVGCFGLNGPLRHYFSLYRTGMVGWCDGAGPTSSAGASYLLGLE